MAGINTTKKNVALQCVGPVILERRKTNEGTCESQLCLAAVSDSCQRLDQPPRAARHRTRKIIPRRRPPSDRHVGTNTVERNPDGFQSAKNSIAWTLFHPAVILPGLQVADSFHIRIILSILDVTSFGPLFRRERTHGATRQCCPIFSRGPAYVGRCSPC